MPKPLDEPRHFSPEFRDILAEVRNFQAVVFRDRGRKLWFRGQRKAEWELRSKLHREVIELGIPPEDQLAALRDIQATAYLRFRHEGWPLLNEDQRKPWGMVFAMQHHGVLTRLLDWTMSFAAALHFAQRERERSDDAAIFVIEPETENKLVTGNDVMFPMPLELHEHNLIRTSTRDVDLDLYHPDVGWPGTDILGDAADLPSLCVLAPLSNARMVAQRSVFMLCGSSMEEEHYHTKLPLPASTYDDAEEFLALVGVNEFTYFPDLAGLGQHLAMVRKGSER